MSTSVAYTNPIASIRAHARLGLALCAFLFLGVGGWAYTTELAGAVIASGQVVIESNVKKIQHQQGGTVGTLLVHEGSVVKAGDILLKLDDTVTRSNLAIIMSNLSELTARRARLEAERDGSDHITFPDFLTSRLPDPEIAKLIASETRVFDLRKVARQSQKAQLSERIAQLHKEIEGMQAQISANAKEVVLMGKELEGVRELWRKNLVPISRVTALERDAVRMQGEGGRLASTVAEATVKISETELQILQVDRDMRSDVAKELSEISAKIAELKERRVAAEDLLSKIDLRAPQDGIVHQLQIHVKGEVIAPGDPVMMIVPDDDSLAVEVKVSPADIDSVHVGQAAALRFTAFNVRTTPEVDGQVYRVSADSETDKRTGTSYYVVRISFSTADLSKLDGRKLVPGMPVEAFIKTDPRTVLSYLMKPISDQMMRAFREK
jgi:HlyD family secretion protein